MDSGQGNSPTYMESAVARSWSRCRPWHLFIAKSQSSSVMELSKNDGRNTVDLVGWSQFSPSLVQGRGRVKVRQKGKGKV